MELNAELNRPVELMVVLSQQDHEYNLLDQAKLAAPCSAKWAKAHDLFPGTVEPFMQRQLCILILETSVSYP